MTETGPAGIEEEEKLSKPTKSDGERKKELIRARPNFIKEIGDSTLETEKGKKRIPSVINPYKSREPEEEIPTFG